MRTLSIRNHRNFDAKYTRTVARRCTALGCSLESGTIELQPDTLVFKGAGPHAKQKEIYVLLGMKRDGDSVTELCVARDVKQPFVLTRLDPSRGP